MFSATVRAWRKQRMCMHWVKWSYSSAVRIGLFLASNDCDAFRCELASGLCHFIFWKKKERSEL